MIVSARLAPSTALRALWLVALIALAAGLGWRDPSPPDEPRFVLAAKHMVESGDWLIPRRGSEYYAHKPAPFMWMQALSYQLVRDWQVAFLLPSLLAGLLTLWLSMDLARRLWSPRIALYAGAALLTCLQFGLQAKRGQIDMVLVALTTLALWGLIRHLLRGPDWPALALAGFAAGLGTVTKGVGFLPLLVLLPWALWRWRRPHAGPVLRGAGWWLLPLGFVLGAGVWLLPVLVALWAQPDPALQQYADEIFFKQTATRYAHAWHHLRPAWYYLQVIATLWLPGALLAPWLLPAWWRRLRRLDPRYLLLLGWALLVGLFFSLSPGKREVYLFPALPAVCIAAAPLLPGLLRRRAVKAVLLGFVLLMSLALLLVALSGWGHFGHWVPRLAERRALSADDLSQLLAWSAAIGGVGLLLAALAGWRRAGSAALLFSAALWTGYGFGLAPALDASSSGRAVMAAVADRLPPTAELGVLAVREQHMLQADRPVADFGFSLPWQQQWQGAAPWLRDHPEQRWLLLEAQALPPCLANDAAIEVGRSNRRHWLLLPGTALPEDCEIADFGDGAHGSDSGDEDV